MFKKLILALAATTALAAPAAAEIEINLYMGTEAPDSSRISGTDVTAGAFDTTIDWEGKSDAMPPYYGARATWWTNSNIGWAFEFSHNKAYAPAAQMAAVGFDRMEFTDGHNILTLNVMKRWPGAWGNKVTPYIGAGYGAAIPHVDIRPVGGTHTFGYQVTGPAYRLLAGASYKINDRWSIYGEYQFTHSDNKVDLEGGGTLETKITSNAFNFGVGIHF